MDRDHLVYRPALVLGLAVPGLAVPGLTEVTGRAVLGRAAVDGRAVGGRAVRGRAVGGRVDNGTSSAALELPHPILRLSRVSSIATRVQLVSIGLF
ncbi:hypothetical protein BJX63DRAFT_275950 [Aspergillus granulosus]|uniref:Secreted protein n=1 Tax=Aspergillus granulosus TaxID=176169 RepID=A0ABR4H9V0_9EURO